MAEKIKAWIQRRRKRKQTEKAVKKETAIIENIEQALNIELYEWQRLYITTGIWQPPEGRQQGRTLAYILRLLLDQSKPLIMYGESEARIYADNQCKEWQYEKATTHYAAHFRKELREIYEQLRAAGVPVREVVFNYRRDSKGIMW